VKAWGRLSIGAAAVLCALAVTASAAADTKLLPRHVEVRPPTSRALIRLGERDGYEIGLSLEEPDFAILYVGKFDNQTQAEVSTIYGTYFEGSPVGRVRARFGSLGSISVHFVPGAGHSGRRGKNCVGRAPRDEYGQYVGRISLRGEGGYFKIAKRRVGGHLSRTFRVRCRVKHAAAPPPEFKLWEEVLPASAEVFGRDLDGGGGSLALLEAQERQGTRRLLLRAAHGEGAPPGAEVSALAFEYQGKMPVGRSAWVLGSPAGTLLTRLPGEHPQTATLKPSWPFSGEATYQASSRLSHSWTGDLSVQFPGLLEPLAGPEFFSTLCVTSSLRTRYGCEALPPDWQPAE
jgi:hypothetical protein